MAPIPFLSAVFPPEPVFTDANLPSLEGKVYIVTGAASGVGLELAKILFLAGGTVSLSLLFNIDNPVAARALILVSLRCSVC